MLLGCHLLEWSNWHFNFEEVASWDLGGLQLELHEQEGQPRWRECSHCMCWRPHQGYHSSHLPRNKAYISYSYIHFIAQRECLDKEHGMAELFRVRLILHFPAYLDNLLVHGRDEATLGQNLDWVGCRGENLMILLIIMIFLTKYATWAFYVTFFMFIWV
jgi:hypothetical protein